MLTWLNKLNTNLNLFSALSKKTKAAIVWLKARKLLTVALIIFLGVGGYISYQKFRPKSIEERYELATVKKESIVQTVVASGKVKSATQVDLKFQASGMLSWVGVKEGDTVKKWQAIASLDKRELQKDLQKYLLDFSKERADYDEDQKITYRDKALTDTIARILRKNEYDLAKSVLDVEIQDIAIKLSTLTTPIDGVVTKIDVPVAGINITPATAAFTVADPEHLVFEAEIDEVDVGSLSVGQSAELILDAFPDDPLQISVSRIDFNATVDSGGATVYQVEFDLEPSDKLRLGLNGEITITVAKVDNTLTVPYSSVDDNEVQVVKDGQVIKAPVTTGVISDDSIEIKSGLNENDEVVVSEKK